ncbi:hypothetical protein [Caulobacter sp. RL271]|jgi:hypothetical protein|uniref:Ig-like domain-containing protein n=1 Tax=Caulobacter segnis TaxID=88688 RepID=A0ABY4ZVQ8_9CAUL|nr:hypothetical protein [Caulobacter segnis]USQ96917.1 hypothetical protein MZV50_04955 [Caulobacter segnis]
MARPSRWPCIAFATIGFAVAAASPPARTSVVSSVTHKPERQGQCFSTRIKQVTFRLFDETKKRPVPGTGSKIYFADGHENVEYNQVAEMDASRSGDPVQLCVHLLPAGPPSCPADDTRGIVYWVKNLRTGKSWESSDAPHNCGGA